MSDDQFYIAFAFHCREDYCNKPPVSLNTRKQQCSKETKYLRKARFRVAILNYSSSKIKLPSDITENSEENIHDAATF